MSTVTSILGIGENRPLYVKTHIITDSGTFSPSSNVDCLVYVIGGGGAGRAYYSNTSGDYGHTTGGGAGGCAVSLLPLSSGTTYTATVGTGGIPAIQSSTPTSGNGTASSFSGAGITTMTANGGGAGNQGTEITLAGGTGGTATGGNIANGTGGAGGAITTATASMIAITAGGSVNTTGGNPLSVTPRDLDANANGAAQKLTSDPKPTVAFPFVNPTWGVSSYLTNPSTSLILANVNASVGLHNFGFTEAADVFTGGAALGVANGQDQTYTAQNGTWGGGGGSCSMEYAITAPFTIGGAGGDGVIIILEPVFA